MAREAGVKVSNFVPPEAESPADVRGRAISFFKDLCNRQKERVDEKESKVLLGLNQIIQSGENLLFLTSVITH